MSQSTTWCPGGSGVLAVGPGGWPWHDADLQAAIAAQRQREQCAP